jgi:type I restriction enzyme S subunit
MSIVKFSDVVRRANTKEDKDNTDKIYYVGGEHIESNNVLISDRGIIKGSTIGPMFYFGFKAGQVLFVSRNPHLRKAGMVTFDGICSEKTFVLETIDEKVLLQKFLPFIMQSNHFWNYMEAHKSGSVNYFINWSTLANYEFELPDINTQKELSELLWAINDTKEAYKRLSLSIDEMVKSRFIEMFGNESKRLRLDELCVHFGDGDWIESKDQSDEGIRLIQTGNVGNGEFIEKEDKSRYISEETFERLNCTEVHQGDILVSRLPDPIGRACMIPQMNKAITAVDCTIIRLREDLLPEFFVNYTKTPTYMVQIDSFTTGSTRKRISRANLGSVLVPVPELNRQQEFVSIVRQSDKSKYELSCCIDSLEKMQQKILNDSLN